MRGSNKVRVALVSLSLFSEAFTTIRDGRFHAWNPVNKIMTQYFDGGISFRRKCVRHSCLVQGPPDWQTRISRFRVRLSAMIAMTIMRNNYLLMLNRKFDQTQGVQKCAKEKGRFWDHSGSIYSTLRLFAHRRFIIYGMLQDSMIGKCRFLGIRTQTRKIRILCQNRSSDAWWGQN